MEYRKSNLGFYTFLLGSTYIMCGFELLLSLKEGRTVLALDDLDFAKGEINKDDIYGQMETRLKLLKHRGPDHTSDLIESSHPNYTAYFISTVLQIQGEILVPQPFISTDGSILVWNGELLNHNNFEETDIKQGDTQLIAKLLNCSPPYNALNNAQGPFSFIYLDVVKNLLWFGKDKFGRRSLLLSFVDPSKIVLSSVGLSGIEVPAGIGIYSINILSGHLTFHPWESTAAHLSPHFLLNKPHSPIDSLSVNQNPVGSLYAVMLSSMRRHFESVTVVAPLGILFSGGVDSVIITCIATEALLSCSETTRNTFSCIHLITVSANNNIREASTTDNIKPSARSSPDRGTAVVSFLEIRERFRGRVHESFFSLICVDISPTDIATNEAHIMSLSCPNNSHMDFNISCALWFGGRAVGRLLSPTYGLDPNWDKIKRAIIAAESIEAAQENRRSKKNPVSTVSSKSKPATASLEEDCKVEKVSLLADEVLQGKQQKQYRGVKCLSCELQAKPGCTALACKRCCSLGSSTSSADSLVSPCPAHTPCKPASSSDNQIFSLDDFLQPYMSSDEMKSNCRVLLVGHGADELFGGYGRHETRLLKGGESGLLEELRLDLGRLWQRNLGRDDRVLSDSARDVRHPYLDEDVVSWVAAQNIDTVFEAKDTAHIGENKPLLRRLAREVLGMHVVANFRKRAIQFGTRLAQQSNITHFGSNRKGSGTAVYDSAQKSIS